MEFTCDVKVIDMPMGAGKSSALINYINDDETDQHFLYVTPLIDEQKRVHDQCAWKNMQIPHERSDNDSKFKCLKDMLRKQQNIVTTHAMFHLFDDEILQLIEEGNYTMILDEVTDVVEEYKISKQDLDLLLAKYIYEDPDTHLLKWKEEYKDYTGKFEQEKQYCNRNCLAYYGTATMVWLFPISIFNAFRNIYILTYMFDAQIQKYYYDYFGLPYTYIGVEGDKPSQYHMVDYVPDVRRQYDYKNLIHICDKEKLNEIGKQDHALSKTWFMANVKTKNIEQLKNNMVNFVRNICKAKSKETLWTTYKDYKSVLAGKGYANSYLYHTARATNDWRDRKYVIYAVNKFMNPFIRQFFVQNNVDVNEDKFALSEMLQFIWRSAIRDGKEIWVYIPSKRMRELFQEWIEENSI